MTNPISTYAAQTEVEVCDWVDMAPASALVTQFARVHILVSLFDGDPEKWEQFIRLYGTEQEREHDLPFIEELRGRLETEPNLLDDLRRLMGDFSALMARGPLPS
ncbi:MAG: hypothetical protein JWN02_2718 [Acidobacteria bacterium]|nr:hypothetical protein [Acidobacteriota bacterium]